MVDLTKDNFEEEVLKAEGTVLVDFYGDGCVPCQALMPHIHAMEGDYGDKIKFTSLNTTKARRLAIGQKILGLPVIAIYKGGEKVAECVKDDATVENIKAMIEANLYLSSDNRIILLATVNTDVCLYYGAGAIPGSQIKYQK